MSILIKGIDLPKEGEHIIALIKTEGKVSYFEQDIETTTCKIMNGDGGRYEHISNNCNHSVEP